jgi:hypothetical protein
MPLVSDTTEYQEFWNGFHNSNLQWVADELLREDVQSDDEAWYALMGWVLEYHPKKLKWFVDPAPTMDRFIRYHWGKDIQELREINKMAREIWPNPGVPRSWYLEKGATVQILRKVLKQIGPVMPVPFRGPIADYFNRFCAYIHPHSYVGSRDRTYTYDADTINRQTKNGTRDQLERLVGPLTPLFVQENRSFLPWEMSPTHIEASEYEEECRRLQASKAGRKAKRLLFENLTEDQQRDYLYKGFFVVAPSDFDASKAYQKRFAIERDFPNGNIWEIENQKIRGDWCYHPDEPYPIDDILLTQKLMIETEVSALREVGNFTNVERLRPGHVDYIEAAV